MEMHGCMIKGVAGGEGVREGDVCDLGGVHFRSPLCPPVVGVAWLGVARVVVEARILRKRPLALAAAASSVARSVAACFSSSSVCGRSIGLRCRIRGRTSRLT